MITATILAVSCGTKGPDTEDEKKNEEEIGSVEDLDIQIDGDFADWAPLTEDTATLWAVCTTLKPDNTHKAIRALKATSDESFIYFYAEIALQYIQVSDIAHEGGDSDKGHGDESPGPFRIYFDADGNSDTGFYTHADLNGDPYIPELGLEDGFELYIFIDSKDGKCKLGWAQRVRAPRLTADGEPYFCEGDYYQQASWYELKDPVGGWDYPEGDNITPAPENFASQVSGGSAKIEFAVDKANIIGLGNDKVAFGAMYDNAAQTASWRMSGLLGPLIMDI